MDGSIRVHCPFAFMQRVAIRIGGEDTSAVGPIEDEMAGGLLKDASTCGDEILMIGKMGRKRQIFRASQRKFRQRWNVYF